MSAGPPRSADQVAMAELRERSERLQLALDAARVGSFVWFIGEDRAEPDPRMLSMFGLPSDGALALAPSDATMIHPDDRDRYAEAVATAVDPESDGALREDLRILLPDGSQRWIAMTGHVRFDDGPPRRPLRMSGAVIDITARKGIADALNASERRQQTLIEGIPQLVWRAGEPGFWTWTSPQWESFTGQVDADSRGWGWLDVVHPIDREQILRLWAAAPERGEFEADYRICERASGRFRWFQTRARPVRDEEGRIVEWLGTSTDVDDLRRLQDRQQVLVSELQHRTRNLMSVVRVTADRSMRRSTTLDEFKLSFHDRLSALARVQALLSRLEDGDRLTFDTLIRSELSVHGALDSRAEQITLDGPDDVRLRSSTVQTLALAMHELATNAAKYGALKQPQATLSVRWRMAPMVGDDRPWLHVDWRESGVCMPPPDSAPQGGGQGRELIEKALPYQLGARTTYELGADGVYCSILLPVSDSRA